MAIVTPTINGYPVCEANVLKARITGRIYSQYELDSTDFATDKAYNGMVLAIDDRNKCVKYPDASTTTQASEVYALHLSSETEYEHKGLNTFAVAREHSNSEPNISVQYPRMFELAKGDTIHTNCVKLDGTHITAVSTTTHEATDLDVLLADSSTTAVYGGVDASGYIKLDTVAPAAGPCFEAVKYATLPNGDWAVKLVVRKA